MPDNALQCQRRTLDGRVPQRERLRLQVSAMRTVLIAIFSVLPALEVAAQTVGTRVTANPRAGYETIKTLHRAEWADRLKTDSVGDTFDLSDCEYESIRWLSANWLDQETTNDRVLRGIASAARVMACLSESLLSAGYPEDVWTAAVRTYESGLIDDVVRDRTGGQTAERDKFDGALSAFLAAHRKTQAASLPGYVATPTRRASGGRYYRYRYYRPRREFKIVTVPSDGRVRLLPMFFYNLCRAQNLDAEDQHLCNHWQEMGDGDLRSVGGIYWYVASWPGGVVAKGRHDFDALGSGEWVVRKPN
jgi:hypothetical protein